MSQRVIVEPFNVSGGSLNTNLEPHAEGVLALALNQGWVIISSSTSSILYANGNAVVYGTFVLEKPAAPAPARVL